MTYQEFTTIVAGAIASGAIKLSKGTELNELDYAIQYALGKEMEERGGKDLTIAPEEIPGLIQKHCGADVYRRAMEKA